MFFNIYIYVYVYQETWRPEEGIESHGVSGSGSAPRSRGHLAYDLPHVSLPLSTQSVT